MDVTVTSTGGNIHSTEGAGLGVVGGADNQINLSETITISFSNFTDLSITGISMVRLASGNAASQAANIGLGETAVIGASGLQSGTIGNIAGADTL